MPQVETILRPITSSDPWKDSKLTGLQSKTGGETPRMLAAPRSANSSLIEHASIIDTFGCSI